jgi:hypothetical protein
MIKVEFYDGSEWIFAAQFHNESNAFDFVGEKGSFRVLDRRGNVLKKPLNPTAMTTKADQPAFPEEIEQKAKEYSGEDVKLAVITGVEFFLLGDWNADNKLNLKLLYDSIFGALKPPISGYTQSLMVTDHNHEKTKEYASDDCGSAKYFIEDLRTGKWLCLGEPIDTSKDMAEQSESQWTNDPNMAISWNTRKEDEETLSRKQMNAD